MEKAGILYGDSASYRDMCRYQSGFFFRHPLLNDIDYYWRVEPDVKFFCDGPSGRSRSAELPVLVDPFETMQSNGFIYGWTMCAAPVTLSSPLSSIYEYRATIETLVRAP